MCFFMYRRVKNPSAAPSFIQADLEKSIMPEEIKLVKDEPEDEFEVEHVYGYRVSDCQ